MTMLMDSSCFNEEVLKQIERVRDIIFNKITPANIHYFDGETINNLRDRFWSAELSKTAWADDSNINGYDVYKIKSMLRYLKSFQTDTAVNYFKFTPEDNYSSGDYVNYEYIIKVPDNYDGRNAFVEYMSPYVDYTELEANLVMGSLPTQEFGLKRRGLLSYATQAVNLDDSTITKFNITQNRNDIKIQVKFRYTAADTHFLSDITIYGKVLFWRFT